MKKILLFCTMLFLLVSCKDMKTCPVCGGRGNVIVSGMGEMQCTGCKGKGEVSAKDYETIKNIWLNIKARGNVNSNSGSRQLENQVQCPMCSGTGVFSVYGNSQTCSDCSGTGYTTASRAAQLRQALQQIDQMTGGSGYDNTSIDDGNYRPSKRSENHNSEQDLSCHYCHGTGECQHCKGIGVEEYEGNYGMPGGVMKCSICKGSKKCDICYGTGHI